MFFHRHARISMTRTLFSIPPHRLTSLSPLSPLAQQVVRVRSVEARRIREPPKRMRPTDKKDAQKKV